MEQNILIVGCGVAGASLASFLALGGGRYRITIVDRVPNLQPHGQNVDIRNEGIQSLRKLGIENQVLESTTGEIGVRHVDENNEIWAEVPVIHDAAVHSPTSEIEILRGRLASICWERSKELGSCLQKSGNGEIEYLFGESISNIEQEPDAVRVTFQSSKETRKFHFVVGADGLRSQTRRLIWGKQKEIDFVKSIGAYGAFFSIPSSTTDSQWRRWCLTPGRKSIMLRPDGTGARTTVLMTIIKQPDLGLEVLAENHAEATPTKKKLLASLFASTGWEAPRILTGMNETNDFYCDEIAQVKMPTWFKGRVFLLGDAAYVSNLEVQDSIELTKSQVVFLANVWSWHDIGPCRCRRVGQGFAGA